MRAIIVLTVLTVSAASPAAAQTATVRVTAPAGADAFVAIGDSVAGRPGDAIAVPADRPVRVALVEAGAAWNPRRASVTVSVPVGDTLGVGLDLPVRVRIETLPAGASVALVLPDGTSRALGTAPLTADLAPGQAGTLVATLAGYREERAPLEASGATEPARPVTLFLAPDGLTADAPPVTLLTTERRDRRGAFLDAGIGALTLAAGAVAVVTKFRADRIDNRYRDPASAERGVESLRDEAQRLDRVSLVALGAMQLGVGAIALRLILR
ncbi:MAG TPA: hypothetical protein VF594_02340 [Rubricoccaceae bacterium]|jgi:hypothetical protein